MEDAPWKEIRRTSYGRVYEVEEGQLLYVFSFGAVVHQGRAGAGEALRPDVERASRLRCLPSTSETYEVVVAEGEGRVRVGWDRVAVADRRPVTLEAVALLLGQSAALERYELTVHQLMEDAGDLARSLATSGKANTPSRQLARRVGRITADRLELARWFFLVDRPDFTWEDPQVARLYDELFLSLELRERHDAMLHKLGVTQEAVETVIDLWQGRRSRTLEWTIVLLIVFEIGMAIFRTH